MAHELDFSNDRVNMAFTGNRNQIWHGLGNELTPGSSIEVWKKEAGMDWEVKESEVIYFKGDQVSKFPKKKVLYRSDNGTPLSIVGSDFKIVHPEEVLEFFRDLTEDHGMVLSTAGCLFGGQRFWALAETNIEKEIFSEDNIKGFLLFMTSVDGMLSSTAKFVSTRVVCNNTLTVALSENSRKNSIIKKSHKTEWDSKKVKIDLGILNSSWINFTEKLEKLANHKMDDKEVRDFYKKTFYDPKEDEQNQGWGSLKKVNELMDLYSFGKGAEFHYGTAYGALNAVTDMFSHGRQRTPDRRFQAAYYDSDLVKNKVLTNLIEMVDVF